jgi:hypothetical protein
MCPCGDSRLKSLPRFAKAPSEAEGEAEGSNQAQRCGDGRLGRPAKRSEAQQHHHSLTILYNSPAPTTPSYDLNCRNQRCAMTHPLEYHIPVRLLIPASVALFGMLLLASNSPAQYSSAGSSGSGHAVGATTSATPSSAAHVSPSSVVFSTPGKTPPSTGGSHGNDGHSHHTITNALPYYYYPYLYAVPFPYSTDVLDNGASDDNDPNYQGGPTVFDRRGAGPYSYIPPGYESPAESNPENAQAEDTVSAGYNSDPEPPSEPTILVFKDGHQLEIENYAIVSQTLYDLTPGHPHKIALTDLDLPATQKQNNDRGVPFDLPSSSQAN